MPYKTLRAIRQAKLKDRKAYEISKDNRSFIIIEASNKKLYQVKFNTIKTRGNQNELITHFIGSNMDAPVLDAAFIEFSPNVLSTILDSLSRETENIIDKECYKQNKLFGIEWHEAARFASSEDEVKYYHSICKNKNDFFAIFPFDQALRNHDRYYKNHIIIKRESDAKPSHYASIDGDRIFNSTGWDKLESEKDRFDCFARDYHKKLYDLIDNKSFTYVRKFAVKLHNIKNETIDLLNETMNENYKDLKHQHSIISDILKYRKERVIEHCNGKCYKKVTQKRLSESGEYNI